MDFCKDRLVTMMTVAQENNIAGMLRSVAMPVVSLRGTAVADKAGLPEKLSVTDGVVGISPRLKPQLAFRCGELCSFVPGISRLAFWCFIARRFSRAAYLTPAAALTVVGVPVFES